MAGLLDHLAQLMVVLVALAPIAMSIFFGVLAFRQPVGRGRVTCLVMSVIALLPILFLVLLGIAVQDD
jgi:hypothetical protein